MSAVIKVENLSKQYRLGQVGTGSLKDDVKRWRYKMMGRQDPFAIVGGENDRTTKSSSNYVLALKDINFEVQEGDILGIIGKNGAGKSTLLKILSRTTGPTTGSLKIKGRIASLLEVGTGFHGELSGRENIYLNGAIMGMAKADIKKRLDEIVDFAGVDRYIDTPVKRYSSGMYVRLAFAVAAHLEPEILIVDEVLAVGDADFQRKALGRMKHVSTQEGRTVLFVSHNMAAITNLCTSGMLLRNGIIESFGSIGAIISKYQETNANKVADLTNFQRSGNGSCRITNIRLLEENNVIKTHFQIGEKLKIQISLLKIIPRELTKVRIVIGVYNLADEAYLRFDSLVTGSRLDIIHETSIITCNIHEHLNIKPDIYSVNIAIFQDGDLIDYIDGVVKFEIDNYDYYGTGKNIENPELSKVFYKHSWYLKSEA